MSPFHTAGVSIPNNAAPGYTQGPYYLDARLKILTFAQSGTWQDTNCGSASGEGEQAGVKWMKAVCQNPP